MAVVEIHCRKSIGDVTAVSVWTDATVEFCLGMFMLREHNGNTLYEFPPVCFFGDSGDVTSHRLEPITLN